MPQVVEEKIKRKILELTPEEAECISMEIQREILENISRNEKLQSEDNHC